MKSEKRHRLRALTARPKLSISFALLVLVGLVAGPRVTASPPQATAVVEIRVNPLEEQIAALESGLVPEPIAIGREADRLRSVNMALAVLARLPDEEVTAIGTESGSLKPTWLADRLASLCSRESGYSAIAWLLCPVVPAGDMQASAQVANLRDALEITADAEHGQIMISFSAGDPDRAAALANLYAETYVQQRQSEKQRLRQRVVDWIIDSAVRGAVHADAAATTGTASSAMRRSQADQVTEAPRSGPSGAPFQSSRADPDRAAHDEFLRQTTPLLISAAWAEPAAVVRSTASPPVRSPAGGLAPMLAVSVSLILGIALGTLVNIVWPAVERRPSLYASPYWPQPQPGDEVTPSRRRVLSNPEPGRQLIATESSAEGRFSRTRQAQLLPSSEYSRSDHATKQSG